MNSVQAAIWCTTVDGEICFLSGRRKSLKSLRTTCTVPGETTPPNGKSTWLSILNDVIRSFGEPSQGARVGKTRAIRDGPVSPYHFAGNNPVVMNDPLGDEYGSNSYLKSWYEYGISQTAGGRNNRAGDGFELPDMFGRSNGRWLFADMLERQTEFSTFISSTFVNGKGVILEHFDDGDFNIYLVMDETKWDGKSKNLPILGLENPTHNYKKGEYLNLANPDHNLGILKYLSDDIRGAYLKELKKRRQWFGTQSVRAPGLLLGWAQLLGIRDTWFFEAFANPQEETNLTSTSNKLSMVGLPAEIAGAKAVGKVMGALSTAFVVHEALKAHGQLTSGDGTKVGIGITAALVPYAWIYTIVDLATAAVSGTSITDRIGSGIDFSRSH